MKKLSHWILLAGVFCLFIVGCSKPVTTPKTGIFTPAVLTALGPVVEGKAQVAFYRPKNFAGSMISYIVREKGVELGKLGSGNYFVVNADPGKHTYTVHTESSEDTNYDFETGKTYFIVGSISMGFFVGHPHLAVSDVDDFNVALPKLTPSKALK